MKDSECGVVMELNGSLAKVRMRKHSDCEHCGICSGDSAVLVDAENALGAKAGDEVLVEFENTDMLKSAFVVYILPLLMGVLGASIGFLLSLYFENHRTSLEIWGAVLFFLGSLFYVKHFDRTVKADGTLPVIVQISSSKKTV